VHALRVRASEEDASRDVEHDTAKDDDPAVGSSQKPRHEKKHASKAAAAARRLIAAAINDVWSLLRVDLQSDDL
jgi:hypothetical protein